MRSKNILFLIPLYIVLCDSLPKWALSGTSCDSGDDCPPNYCCAIGFTRYSIPQCRPVGQMGNWCRVYNEPQNKTLAFPNGEYFHFSQIYTQFCPCSPGLSCERAKCVPESNRINFDSSFLDLDY